MLIPWKELQSETLINLLEEFVSREGTDYGHQDYSLSQKVGHVQTRLQREELVVVYDHESETCNIMLKDKYLADGIANHD